MDHHMDVAPKKLHILKHECLTHLQTQNTEDQYNQHGLKVDTQDLCHQFNV